MNAIPPHVEGRAVDPTGRYTCPMCEVQRAGDPEDTGWVSCPMLGNRMICLGSCIDFQKMARAGDFDEEGQELVARLEVETGGTTSELRLSCLRHQLQIVESQLQARGPTPGLEALRKQLLGALAAC